MRNRIRPGRNKEIDLGRYDPYTAFVPLLETDLKLAAEGLSEDASRKAAQIVARQRLAGLSDEAFAPAIDSVLRTLDPSRNSDLPPGIQRTVYGYFEQLTERSPDDLPDPLDQALRVRYNWSQRNAQYHFYFNRLVRIAGEAGSKLEEITENYEWVVDQDPAPTPFAFPGGDPTTMDILITSSWRTLRETLAKEREFDKKAKSDSPLQARQITPQSANQAMALFPGIEMQYPGLLGQAHDQYHQLWQTSNRIYAEVLEASTPERARSAHLIDLTLRHLDTIPHDSSLRVLWDSVLDDSEREAILRSQVEYKRAQELIDQAKVFPSYKDPAFQAFQDRYSDYRDQSWEKMIIAGPRALEAVRDVLIGKGGIPAYLRKALAFEGPRKPALSYSFIEAIENDNYVESFATDMATLLLAGQIPTHR